MCLFISFVLTVKKKVPMPKLEIANKTMEQECSFFSKMY